MFSTVSLVKCVFCHTVDCTPFGNTRKHSLVRKLFLFCRLLVDVARVMGPVYHQYNTAFITTMMMKWNLFWLSVVLFSSHFVTVYCILVTKNFCLNLNLVCQLYGLRTFQTKCICATWRVSWLPPGCCTSRTEFVTTAEHSSKYHVVRMRCVVLVKRLAVLFCVMTVLSGRQSRVAIITYVCGLHRLLLFRSYASYSRRHCYKWYVERKMFICLLSIRSVCCVFVIYIKQLRADYCNK